MRKNLGHMQTLKENRQVFINLLFPCLLGTSILPGLSIPTWENPLPLGCHTWSAGTEQARLHQKISWRGSKDSQTPYTRKPGVMILLDCREKKGGGSQLTLTSQSTLGETGMGLELCHVWSTIEWAEDRQPLGCHCLVTKLYLTLLWPHGL